MQEEKKLDELAASDRAAADQKASGRTRRGRVAAAFAIFVACLGLRLAVRWFRGLADEGELYIDGSMIVLLATIGPVVLWFMYRAEQRELERQRQLEAWRNAANRSKR
jgi:hypothetical protein